jgi:hypothetical protein
MKRLAVAESRRATPAAKTAKALSDSLPGCAKGDLDFFARGSPNWYTAETRPKIRVGNRKFDFDPREATHGLARIPFCHGYAPPSIAQWSCNTDCQVSDSSWSNARSPCDGGGLRPWQCLSPQDGAQLRATWCPSSDFATDLDPATQSSQRADRPDCYGDDWPGSERALHRPTALGFLTAFPVCARIGHSAPISLNGHCVRRRATGIEHPAHQGSFDHHRPRINPALAAGTTGIGTSGGRAPVQRSKYRR